MYLYQISTVCYFVCFCCKFECLFPRMILFRYMAIEKGLIEVVRRLLQCPGVNVNDRVTSESSAVRPIHVAILHGQSHMLPMLISHGVDVNIADEDRLCTPLHMATILQDVWCVRQLLKAGAVATSLSREGRTPLYIATEKDNCSIIRMLVSNPYHPHLRIGVNRPTTNESHRGAALHIAAMFDSPFAVTELLDLGAAFNLRDAMNKKPIEIALETESRVICVHTCVF